MIFLYCIIKKCIICYSILLEFISLFFPLYLSYNYWTIDFIITAGYLEFFIDYTPSQNLKNLIIKYIAYEI